MGAVRPAGRAHASQVLALERPQGRAGLASRPPRVDRRRDDRAGAVSPHHAGPTPRTGDQDHRNAEGRRSDPSRPADAPTAARLRARREPQRSYCANRRQGVITLTTIPNRWTPGLAALLLVLQGLAGRPGGPAPPPPHRPPPPR